MDLHSTRTGFSMKMGGSSTTHLPPPPMNPTLELSKSYDPSIVGRNSSNSYSLGEGFDDVDGSVSPLGERKRLRTFSNLSLKSEESNISTPSILSEENQWASPATNLPNGLNSTKSSINNESSFLEEDPSFFSDDAPFFRFIISKPQINFLDLKTGGTMIIAANEGFVEGKKSLYSVISSISGASLSSQSQEYNIKNDVRLQMDRVRAYTLPTDLDVSDCVHWVDDTNFEMENDEDENENMKVDHQEPSKEDENGNDFGFSQAPKSHIDEIMSPQFSQSSKRRSTTLDDFMTLNNHHHNETQTDDDNFFEDEKEDDREKKKEMDIEEEVHHKQHAEMQLAIKRFDVRCSYLFYSPIPHALIVKKDMEVFDSFFVSFCFLNLYCGID